MSSIPLIQPQVASLIQNRLQSSAQEGGVRILYAGESGSRAWGFPSPDSDYDIRFIYAHPIDWYLSVDESRDVIERPIERHELGEIDLGAWDLRKTLRLVKKSNPVIWEWLQSPIVYHQDTSDIIGTLRQGIDPFFSPISACHHYLSICRGTMERELQGQTVKIKKYFYMLRPILAAAWIERYKTVPPMEFAPLMQLLVNQSEVRSKVDELLARKHHTDERIPIERESVLDVYLESEIDRLKESASLLPATKLDGDELDFLFRKLLGSTPC